MRRAVFLFALMALALGGGVALAATVTGTDRGETLYGTHRADTIRAHGGDDTVYARSGPDRIYGGAGNDQLYGGRGDDHILAFDSLAGKRDVIDCGPGYDTFEADQKDVYHDDCEEGSVSQP